jgi:hypothetical protein
MNSSEHHNQHQSEISRKNLMVDFRGVGSFCWRNQSHPSHTRLNHSRTESILANLEAAGHSITVRIFIFLYLSQARTTENLPPCINFGNFEFQDTVEKYSGAGLGSF